MLIEIKDNHIWHKEQVSSGKWLAKENLQTISNDKRLRI
jgi:hypothetical protein